jgi:hypothetical protein
VTTDGLDQALAAAGLNLLRGAGLTVYDGDPPDDLLKPGTPVPPYVVVWVHLLQPGEDGTGANGLDGLSRSRLVGWYCHCVGGDAVAARAVAQQARTALIDRRPVIAGVPDESIGLIREVDSAPASRDTSLSVPVFDALRVFELHISA